MIRAVWVGINLFVITVPLASVVMIATLLRVRRERFYDRIGRIWSGWILRASGTPVHVEGLENIRPDAPQVFASNHQSWYDVFALAHAIPKRYRFVAKQELARIPLFGPAWKACGHISINRSERSAAIRSLDRAGQIIRQDDSSVIIFPEGTRSPDGSLLPFKRGAFMLALRTGVDIIPTAVLGTRAILPKGAWRTRAGPITVRFGAPISTAGYTEGNREGLIRQVRDRIEELRSSPTRSSRIMNDGDTATQKRN